LCLFVLSFSIQAELIYKDSDGLPNKPVAKHVLPIIHALNSRDVTTIKQYLHQHFSEDWTSQINQSVEYFLILANSYGKLKYHSYREYKAPLASNEIVIILYSELTESWLAATLIGDADTVSLFDLSPAKRPSNVAQLASQPLSSAVDNIAKYTNRVAQRDMFSGAILLAKKDKVLWQDAFGQASKRFDVANTLDTRFELASVSKLFTGVAITMLVAQDKIKFQDRIGQYLGSDWISPENASKITIEQLLAHTSGLGNSVFNHPDLSKKTRKTLNQLSDYQYLVRREAIVFEPGSEQRYSNTGTFLAGVIVEKVSGMDYFSFIQQNIFKPAGMTKTGYFDLTQPYKQVATGYERVQYLETGWRNNFLEGHLKGSPASGAISTVGDMHKFGLALLSHQLLNKKLTKKFYSLYQYPGMPYMNHAGLHFGMGTNFDLYPELGFISVTLSNYTQGASHVAARINAELSRLKSN
jgi:CubicO group peptidase (beta-lactamase class C family)